MRRPFLFLAIQSFAFAFINTVCLILAWSIDDTTAMGITATFSLVGLIVGHFFLAEYQERTKKWEQLLDEEVIMDPEEEDNGTHNESNG